MTKESNLESQQLFDKMRRLAENAGRQAYLSLGPNATSYEVVRHALYTNSGGTYKMPFYLDGFNMARKEAGLPPLDFTESVKNDGIPPGDFPGA